MNRYLLFSFCLSVSIIISCEYELNGTFERELNQNTFAPFIETVKLDLSMEEDTIELMYNRIYFHFESSAQEVRRVNFYINDKLVGTVESNNSYFDFNYDLLYVGAHRLRLELIAGTGTGSIAESIGMEGYVFTSKEWILLVKDIDYNKLTTSVSNGFLKLHFPRSVEKIDEFIVFRSNYEIGRTNSYEFIDKGYVGEGGKYYVKYVDSKTGELQIYGSVVLPKEIEFKYTYDRENNYAIEWSNWKYYSAVDTIIVFSNDYNSYNSERVDKTTDISNGKIEIPKNFFGSRREYKLVLVPKYHNPVFEYYSNPYRHYSSSKQLFTIGYPGPIFEYLFRIDDSHFLYYTSRYDLSSTSYNDSIFRYSANKNKVIESSRYNPPNNYAWSGDHYSDPSVSPDGKLFFAIVGFTNTAIINPTNDFTDYKIIDISNLTSNRGKVPISNVGTVLITSSTNRKIYLFDFKNEKVLGDIHNTTSLSGLNISYNGELFFKRVSHTVWLFSYKNKKITPLDTIMMWGDDIGIDFFDFKQNEPNRLVSWDKGSKIFSILSYPGLKTMKSFSVNEEEIVDIDYFKNRILSFSPNLLVVRSLNDGEIVHEFPVVFTRFFQNECYLVGNSIFNKNGARYYFE